MRGQGMCQHVHVRSHTSPEKDWYLLEPLKLNHCISRDFDEIILILRRRVHYRTISSVVSKHRPYNNTCPEDITMAFCFCSTSLFKFIPKQLIYAEVLKYPESIIPKQS